MTFQWHWVEYENYQKKSMNSVNIYQIPLSIFRMNKIHSDCFQISFTKIWNTIKFQFSITSLSECRFSEEKWPAKVIYMCLLAVAVRFYRTLRREIIKKKATSINTNIYHSKYATIFFLLLATLPTGFCSIATKQNLSFPNEITTELSSSRNYNKLHRRKLIRF